ncbi:MAG: hypothetical protein JWQ16_887 [Novosphingobium sp.]|nr:hypothetical protein [Novosphingobium sp.]
MRSSLSLADATIAVAVADTALAASATVTIELPRIDAAPYRKPYVAVWLEDARGKQVRMVSVFHDQARIGGRWLPDLRTWWRAGGRAMTMPADGISRPTQAPGRHTVTLRGLEGLAPGRYTVVVEAAREKGGRDLVKVPFEWAAGRRGAGSARGTTELGAVAVSVLP